jgi:SRSO17 transposase
VSDAAHEILRRRRLPRAEWLVIEWPAGAEHASDYWLSNLPAATPPTELARLASLRWTIELDYRQLKGELGLDHYEGRSYAGWHHHCAFVTCVHAFLTEERLDPAGLTLPQAVLLLQPVLACWDGHCRTCHQPIDLNQLILLPRRK